MRPAPRVVVPLKSMCSRACERPAPSHLPSSMLPVLHQACTETTGALWSSRITSVRPLGSVLNRTPGGMAGRAVLTARRGKAVKGADIISRERTVATCLPEQLQLRAWLGLAGFRFGFDHGRFGRRHERQSEHLVEIVAAFKVVATVVLGFCEEVVLDHVKDDFPKVCAATHAPFVEDGQRHWSELVQRAGADAGEQFLAGDMPDLALGQFLAGGLARFALSALAEHLLGMIQG